MIDLLSTPQVILQEVGFHTWLTTAEPSQAWEIHWIEEDLERTRKIAACGLLSREDILKLLLPVLPLQYQPVLEREDVATRLNRQIRAIAPAAADPALDDKVTPTEVIRLLGAET